MDGLGAQTWKAGRVQPARSRRRRHDFHCTNRRRITSARIRYVITLDSDTQLPRDVARKLIGAAVHPLNRPHGLIRTPVALLGVTEFCNRGSASRWKAHRARDLRGSSPATPASILTQLPCRTFIRICFVKGTLPARVCMTSMRFRQRLRIAFLKTHCLSHDLFESLFARAALVTDIELLDEYPASYDAYAQAATSLDPRRLANFPMAFSHSARRQAKQGSQPAAFNRALENTRQPAPQSGGAVAFSLAAGGVDHLSRFGPAVDTVRGGGDCFSCLPSRDHQPSDSSARHSMDQPLLERLGRRANQHRPGRAVVVLLAASGVPDARRDRSHDISKSCSRERNCLNGLPPPTPKDPRDTNLSAFFWFMLPAELLALGAAGLTSALGKPAFSTMAAFVMLWLTAPAVAYWVSTAR